ncbi:MAG: hypothetical protein E7451_06985 [Ruminococcaceae bacterium]|nr:hypothetical protein [Oscillospiraceae bacterium]
MKKLIALLLAVCLMTGCQLASEEKNEDRIQDKLVGIFVTFDHLELEFDMEGYLNDNAHAIADGDEILIEPGEGMEYEERLWAEIGENGWEFPGYEGILMGQMWEDDHWVGFSTEGFCEHKTHVTRTDVLDSIDEEGTIYVPFGTEVMLCTNPVYMTADGSYYALRGDSFHSTVDYGPMSQSISDEMTWTIDGEEFAYSAKFTAVVQGVKLSDRVVLVQMSADHTELAREEYLPGEMPETITPAAGTAYIIAEEYAGDEVTRTLYQPGGDPIKVFCQGEQVYCLPRFTEIMWPE